MKKKESARLHSERRTRGDDRHKGRGKQNGPTPGGRNGARRTGKHVAQHEGSIGPVQAAM